MIAGLIARLVPYRWLILAALLFGAGWQINGWRLNAEIADLKREHAEEKARESQKELDDFITASKTIKDAAQNANLDVSSLNKQLAAIHKEFKDAQRPLPADCKPDGARLQRLAKSVEATRNAATGQ